MAADDSDVTWAAWKVYAAIKNEGPAPAFHRETMRRHRAEWPTLWQAIDALLAELAKEKRPERHESLGMD